MYNIILYMAKSYYLLIDMSTFIWASREYSKQEFTAHFLSDLPLLFMVRLFFEVGRYQLWNIHPVNSNI